MSMENAGTAFALVCAAGAATGIGAAVVFFPRLAKLANRRFLGCSLGLAAGVMLYVSLVEIYGKSIAGFMASGHDESLAFMFTSLCFFGGIFLMMSINFVVGKLLEYDHSAKPEEQESRRAPAESTETSDAAVTTSTVVVPVGVAENADFERLQEIVDHLARQYKNQDVAEYDDNGRLHVLNELNAVVGMKSDGVAPGRTPTSSTVTIDDEDEEKEDPLVREGARKLMHMGVATALAIAIHNFPEGLITFVAYTEEPAVGIVLAVGIGIHNIPEGLCVAMPIYYATGNRLRAFLWGILSGVSEPFGALIGLVVLKGSMSGNSYGIMFGFVAGIMTLIAADELLPTAHRYDPQNELVTYSFIVGMFAIAVSLVLFASS